MYVWTYSMWLYNVNVPFLQNERNYRFIKHWKNGHSCCLTETIEERYFSDDSASEFDFDMS